jgi:hypothetical protein
VCVYARARVRVYVCLCVCKSERESEAACSRSTAFWGVCVLSVRFDIGESISLGAILAHD